MKELFNTIKSYYNILDNLTKRLQDNYNDGKKFEQKEEDRIALCSILECFDNSSDKEINELNNIVCLKFREIENWDDNCGNFERYVIRDANFEQNFEKLSNLMLTYDNFQEIEDFFVENFQEIKMEDYEINY